MSIKNKNPLNVVVVFAHPDDEAGVIGTMANHCEKGDNVYAIFLTRGENASSLCCSPEEIMEIRAGHARKIEKILGAEYRLLDLPDSGVQPSVENAKKLAEHFKEIKPDIIITWTQSEQLGIGHPDHRYTYQITLDAISYMRYKEKDSKLEPHRAVVSLYTNYFDYNPTLGKPFFVDVTNQFNKIMQVLEVYSEAYGGWPVNKYIEAQLTMNGRMAGVKYAEAFHKILWRTAQPYLF
ncbi:MAG TPA: PIG-L family deacetylase [candidate division Zixibacteria bacterium]|nr:PIG-L family deacetylase [candidate division Zixibacteria bacterium]HUU88040.1 PIG-L family deacetylase [Candidatus Glassbacteria bacterium]